MDEPKVMIGDREFSVPEFPFWAQRKVSPMLMRASRAANDLEDDKRFGELLDAIYTSLTINTKNGKPDGEKINDISKEDFECLRIKSLHLALEVLPLLLRQAGLTQDKSSAANGSGGAAPPETPLPGATTSTTS